MAHVATHPDATLAELVEWSAAKRGVTVCVATMWATLEALGVTLKKKTCHAAEQEREDVAAARQAWRATQADLNINQLVFIDDADALTGRNERNHPHDGPGRQRYSASGCSNGQDKLEYCASRYILGNPQSSVVGLDYRAADRKAHSHAVRFRREQWVEDPIDILRGDAPAAVRH
jgi:hypothetical protein